MWLDAGTCVASLRVGVVWSRRCPSKPVSAYERFKEAGEDIGGVRRLMELTGDAARCWLFYHIRMSASDRKVNVSCSHHSWSSSWCMAVTIEALLEG